MRVGSRVELMVSGEQGRLESFDYHLPGSMICTVILDDGREVKPMLFEVGPVRDKVKKKDKERSVVT